MKYPSLIIAALFGGIIGGSIGSVWAANQLGLFPVGTLTNGQCLQVQATGSTNGVIGITCPVTTLSLGNTVVGASPNVVLTTDANGKLSQLTNSVLTAN